MSVMAASPAVVSIQELHGGEVQPSYANNDDGHGGPRGTDDVKTLVWEEFRGHEEQLLICFEKILVNRQAPQVEKAAQRQTNTTSVIRDVTLDLELNVARIGEDNTDGIFRTSFATFGDLFRQDAPQGQDVSCRRAL